MARPRECADLVRKKITIEDCLYKEAKDYAKFITLGGGFSGLVSRLLIRQLRTKGSRVALLPARLKPLRKNTP